MAALWPSPGMYMGGKDWPTLQGAGMGNKADVRREPAEFHEPFPPSSVEGDGSGRDRRSGPPEASTEDEARHEAPPPHSEPSLPVRPQDADRVDRGPETCGAPSLSGIALVPPPGHHETQGDHQASGRPAHAGDAPRRHPSRMVDLPTLTFEDAGAAPEDRPLMGEALRILATWLGRLERMSRKSQRRAA